MNEVVKTLITMMRHRDHVRLNLQALIQELQKRALVHDMSKLEEDEFEGFCNINRVARENAIGSEAYEKSLKTAKCIPLHFSRNSHHPEYYEDVQNMEWLDIIEMVLDWKAASDTYGTSTLKEGLPYHFKRHNFTPEQQWLINQVVDWIDPGPSFGEKWVGDES